MLDSLSEAQLCETTLLAFEAFRQALTTELETPFEIWVRATAPARCLTSESPQDLGPLVEALWPEMAGSTACLPIGEHRGFQSDDQHRLVIATDVDDPALAVVGAVPCRSDEFLVRLVENIRTRVRCESELADNESHLDEFAYQVTTDFEELTWLRDLADHIEVCEVQKDLATVASIVLPTLQGLIRAEAIALLVPGCDAPDRTGPEESGGDMCRYTIGDLPIDNQTCEQLVRSLWREATDKPLVRNAKTPDAPTEATFGMRSFILVQIARDDHRYGWLLVMNRCSKSRHAESEGMNAVCLSEWEFGTFEAGLLRAAASMLATHARNSDLFHEKEQLIIGIIRALTNAIDAKDPYTCGHSDRVALIARRLAVELELDANECERIYMAGLLHDVGKIGVPDDVLCKAGPLTDEEFTRIKQHPQIGYSILHHVRQLQYVLPGVLHHHESLDGRGYPSGLSGEEIPLHGRILAVADAFDAMTSTRSYRKAMPPSKAESILREGAGTQWDPAIVEALFACLPDIWQICAEDASRRGPSPEEAPADPGARAWLPSIPSSVSLIETAQQTAQR